MIEVVDINIVICGAAIFKLFWWFFDLGHFSLSSCYATRYKNPRIFFNHFYIRLHYELSWIVMQRHWMFGNITSVLWFTCNKWTFCSLLLLIRPIKFFCFFQVFSFWKSSLQFSENFTKIKPESSLACYHWFFTTFYLL